MGRGGDLGREQGWRDKRIISEHCGSSSCQRDGQQRQAAVYDGMGGRHTANIVAKLLGALAACFTGHGSNWKKDAVTTKEDGRELFRWRLEIWLKDDCGVSHEEWTHGVWVKNILEQPPLVGDRPPPTAVADIAGKESGVSGSEKKKSGECVCLRP